MANWHGIGMNYGHHVSDTSYNIAQVKTDFNYLKSKGVHRIRIAFPDFDDTTMMLAHCQDMVTRALNHGFYAVWGIAVGYGEGTITAERWEASKAYILGTLVPWAKLIGLSELCLGNEYELDGDAATLPATTIRADLRAMATSIKAGGYTGKISYVTSISGEYYKPWIAEGIGDLDLIGWNSYDNFGNFDSRNKAIVSALGSKTYISEFGSITNGYSDYNSETLWYNDVLARIKSMQKAGVQSGYFFCYRDGSFGLTPNTYALVENNGNVRLARNAVLGR